MLSKSLLREVIIEQREEINEIFERERIIEREASKETAKFIKVPNILAILGVRRCGKSIFSHLIFKEKTGYINFDDERLVDIEARDLNKILEIFYELYGPDLEKIILDEPQRIRGWELFVNRLRRTKKVIVTGSNSQLLSGELATALTGRHITFELFPFSFREILVYNQRKIAEITTKERSMVFKDLLDSLENGGFPERFKWGKRIIREIYHDILYKDIIRRGKIKKITELTKISNFLVSNFSKEFTFKSLTSISRVKHLSTISKWIELLKEAYLLFVLERFSFKLKESVYAPKKVYCIDNGIATAIGFRFSQNIGRLMENFVAIELLRKRSYWYPEWEIYYFKDYQQREVDFVIKEGLKVKQLIQVTYASDKDEIERREIKSLLKASDLLRCKDLLVITWDYEGEEEIMGKKIKFIPLWKWLIKI